MLNFVSDLLSIFHISFWPKLISKYVATYCCEKQLEFQFHISHDVPAPFFPTFRFLCYFCYRIYHCLLIFPYFISTVLPLRKCLIFRTALVSNRSSNVRFMKSNRCWEKTFLPQDYLYISRHYSYLSSAPYHSQTIPRLITDRLFSNHFEKMCHQPTYQNCPRTPTPFYNSYYVLLL